MDDITNPRTMFGRIKYRDKEGNQISPEKMEALLGDPNNYRMVARDYYKNLRISTVWLGVPFWGGTADDGFYPDCYFETMIFDDSKKDNREWSSLYLERYRILQEAQEGHKKIVQDTKLLDDLIEGKGETEQ